MRLLHIIFYRGLFFFSMPIYLWAAYNSEISLAYHYGKPYNGCKVTFQVYEGTEEAKKRVWTGQLSFHPEGLALVDISSLSRKQIDPEIKLRYVFNSPRYTASCGTVPPLPVSKSPDGFTHEETACMEDSIIAGNMITWRLNNHAMNIQDVVDTVNSLKDNGGRFPKFKLYGCDWDDNVANCVTFSCRFLRAFGVDINACTELRSWLEPIRNSLPPYFVYYVLGFGWTRDHIRLRDALLSVAQYHNNVKWNRGGIQSSAPKFALKSIADVLDAAAISSIRAFIQ